MRQALLSTVLGLLLFAVADGQDGLSAGPLEEGWKGIKVFKTHRAEVEKILGKPFEANGEARYRTDQALIYVLYSRRPCSSPDSLTGGFKIDRETVLRYQVVPTNEWKIENVEWQKHLFTRIEDTHQLGFIHYGNSKLGISVTTVKMRGSAETVRTIYFDRTKEQDAKFACKRDRLH